MLISALQTKSIFCSHCQIKPDTITVGIVALRDYGLIGQVVELVQTEDRSGDRYRVRVPAVKFNPDYNVVLERV
jgi:hypothetical protein